MEDFLILLYLVSTFAFGAAFMVTTIVGVWWVVKPEQYGGDFASCLKITVALLALLWLTYLLLPAEIRQ